MGVPGFFAWLLRKYRRNNIIISELPHGSKVKELFIDANCLFHPQCFKVLDHIPKWKSRKALESKMMKRIINYIDYIIGLVDPEQVMISVDGVAPAAKMSQQRKRRFRSFDDAVMRDDIKRKYGKTVANPWSNIVITPGTHFMENLHQTILKYMKRKKIKIRYSSYHTPGEGEHKLLKYVREAVRNKKSKDDIHVIYGLDADLIFLSLASQKNNIYLLREDNYLSSRHGETKVVDIISDVAEDLKFVSIDEMKELFFDFLSKKVNQINKEIKLKDVNKVMNDFVVICFFLGNDFLPHIPSINISIGGLDMVLEAYTSVYCLTKQYLVSLNPASINHDFLEMFLEYMSDRENYYFKVILQKKKEANANRKTQLTGYEKELWDLDNMKSFIIDDPVRLGKGESNDWKYKYYSHHFKADGKQQEFIDVVCYHYFTGVMWVLKYYFEGCASWSWNYPLIHAPFVSDLYKYIKTSNINLDSIELDKNKPLEPCQQLLAVLPPVYAGILPKVYQPLVLSAESPIIDLYPQQVVLDMLHCDKYWKCLPLIPNVNPDRIRQASKKCKLTSDELIRNEELDEFVNWKKK